MKILLDTSILIDHIRQKETNQTPLYKLSEGGHEFCISILSHTECYSGKSIWERKNAKEALEAILSNIKILPLDIGVSKKAGEIRAKYSVGVGDAVIAATALIHELPIATLNSKDFQKVERVKILPRSGLIS